MDNNLARLGTVASEPSGDNNLTFEKIEAIRKRFSKMPKYEIWLMGEPFLPFENDDGEKIHIIQLDLDKINKSEKSLFDSLSQIGLFPDPIKGFAPGTNRIILMSWVFYSSYYQAINLSGIPIFTSAGKRVRWGEIVDE